MAQMWEVVGGEEHGGIIVREGESVSSAQTSERLSTGALIEEIELQDERLNYTLIQGTGPATGWISIKLHEKDLAIKTDKKRPDEPKPTEIEPNEPEEPLPSEPKPTKVGPNDEKAPCKMRKILAVGLPGHGKSTLLNEIADQQEAHFTTSAGVASFRAEMQPSLKLDDRGLELIDAVGFPPVKAEDSPAAEKLLEKACRGELSGVVFVMNSERKSADAAKEKLREWAQLGVDKLQVPLVLVANGFEASKRKAESEEVFSKRREEGLASLKKTASEMAKEAKLPVSHILVSFCIDELEDVGRELTDKIFKDAPLRASPEFGRRKAMVRQGTKVTIAPVQTSFLGLDETQAPYDPRTNHPKINANVQWVLTILGWSLLLSMIAGLLIDWISRIGTKDHHGIFKDGSTAYWAFFWILPFVIFSLGLPLLFGLAGSVPLWQTCVPVLVHPLIILVLGTCLRRRLMPYICGLAMTPFFQMSLMSVCDSGIANAQIQAIKTHLFVSGPLALGLLNVVFSLFGKYKFWILILCIVKASHEIQKCYKIAKNDSHAFGDRRSLLLNNPQYLRMYSVITFDFFVGLLVSWAAETQIEGDFFGNGFHSKAFWE